MLFRSLIPAGTGFRIFQDSEVTYRKEALEDLVNRGTAASEQSFPLLNEAPKSALDDLISQAKSAEEVPEPPSDTPAVGE